MRPNKSERLDPINIYDKIETLSAKVMKLSIDDAHKIESFQNMYWDSPEAVLIFKPKLGESVVECLSRRDRLLVGAAFDNNKLQ